MSKKTCPVCSELSDQCLLCNSYVVDGERIYYNEIKNYGAIKEHELQFIEHIHKHHVVAFFHKGKLYIPSRQGRSVPLAIGLQWSVWQLKQVKIDQLKAKNTQLTHALVNANAEKSKWQKDYWSQVERSAEYGAMLMTDPDSLQFKCYQKEKQNEELVKQLKIQQVILSALKPRLHKTDMGDCLHFGTTMFHEGKAECFDCGSVVNHERKVIGVRRGEHEN